MAAVREALAIEGVTRRFGAAIAVRDVTLAIETGELHAIVGENGAGKSTLLKMAAGLLPPSAGRVVAGGRALEPATPAEATRRGIGLVHQHFMLIGAFTALENLMLGSEPAGFGGRLDRAAARAKATALAERTGLRVPLDALADDLPVGERQRLEILRVLYRDARFVLLDEPTAVLSPVEADDLYAVLRKLAEGGRAVAVVTHRLDEVVRFADRVTVMRRGEVVLSKALGDREGRPRARLEDELARAIMGGDPPPEVAPPPVAENAPVALSIEGLALDDGAGRTLLDDVHLAVRAGEIVGVAGVEGNGQRELVRALAGLEPRARGRIVAGGVELGPARGAAAVRARRAVLAVVHEDRHRDGLLLETTVADNLVLGDLGDPHDAPFDEREVARRRIERFGVVPPDPARWAGELSGGNQQKLVVGRALDRLVRSRSGARAATDAAADGSVAAKGAAVLAQPTRGVDVGAAAAIHAAIREAAEAGLALLIVSADLAELRRLAHRIVVLRRGRLVAELPPTAAEDAIGRAMLGVEAA